MSQKVLEYKTKEVYPRGKKSEEMEAEYKANEEPCMVLQVQTPQGWYCLNAKRKFNTLGRLLNHAAPREATAKPFKLLMVYGRKEKMKGRQVVMSIVMGRDKRRLLQIK